MCGTDAFHGDYCFRLGNGDVGCDPSLIATWLMRNGYTRVAVLAPWTPISEEYFRYLPPGMPPLRHLAWRRSRARTP